MKLVFVLLYAIISVVLAKNQSILRHAKGWMGYPTPEEQLKTSAGLYAGRKAMKKATGTDGVFDKAAFRTEFVKSLEKYLAAESVEQAAMDSISEDSTIYPRDGLKYASSFMGQSEAAFQKNVVEPSELRRFRKIPAFGLAPK